jgi:hypothetical protein
VNGGFEWTHPLAKEDREVVAGHGADFSPGVEPADFESEHVAVVPLSSLHILDRKLRRRMTELRPQLLLAHDILQNVFPFAID